jgi:hypothetical protein
VVGAYDRLVRSTGTPIPRAAGGWPVSAVAQAS